LLPTYEYHCPKCKATYELRQGFDAETTHPCEECGKGTAKRVLHVPAVAFKGSGWYVTDSKSSSKSKSAASSESKSDGESATPAAAETKPKSDAPAKAESSAAASTSSESAAAS
jgi:putative FmdB family regulatory protein